MVNPKFYGHISRLNRGVRSIPVADLLMVILILATILTVPTLAGGNFLLKFILVVMVIVLIVKTAVEYRHKKYDFELVFIFDEAFEKLVPQRKAAANVCKKYLDLKSQKGEIEKWGEMETPRTGESRTCAGFL
jgi:ABC-type siderophore export system fused ATPase/permease subunit